MKVSVAQINTTPGDFFNNILLIEKGIKEAASVKSRLVVFPELTICGYNVKDMMYDSDFVDKNLKSLNHICKVSKNNPDLYIFVGYIDNNTTGIGKPFRNMAAVIKNGFIIATHQKQLLPMTDVFDESRWFEPGDKPTVLNIDGYKVSVNICEECWYDDKGYNGIINHHKNPIQEIKDIGCDVIVSLNSSPYYYNKPTLRKKIMRQIIHDNKIKYIIYANQYGAQDDLIFDGNSMIIKQGSFITIKNKIMPKNLGEVELLTTELKDKSYSCGTNVNEDLEHLSMVLLGLRDYVVKSGFENIVVGSSGGIDSAVVIALASMVLNGQNVHAIKMPSKWSSDHSVSDAVKLHKAFGVNDYTVKIDHIQVLKNINDQLELKNYHSVADENIQARQRGQVLMHFSNATGALLLNTGNKTELALGYCTIGGDMLGGFNPIGDLYKLEVYKVAKLINEYYDKEMIPDHIISKAPSAELAPDQTDESSLLPYPILDPIVRLFIEDNVNDYDCFINQSHINSDQVSKEQYDSMISRINNMEFKRRLAPLCTKLTKKSFGSGRRYPVVKKNG